MHSRRGQGKLQFILSLLEELYWHLLPLPIEHSRLWKEVRVRREKAQARSDLYFSTVTIRKAEASGTPLNYSVATVDTNEPKTAPGKCGTEHSGILNCSRITVTRQWMHCQTSRWSSTNSYRGLVSELSRLKERQLYTWMFRRLSLLTDWIWKTEAQVRIGKCPAA